MYFVGTFPSEGLNLAASAESYQGHVYWVLAPLNYEEVGVEEHDFVKFK